MLTNASEGETTSRVPVTQSLILGSKSRTKTIVLIGVLLTTLIIAIAAIYKVRNSREAAGASPRVDASTQITFSTGLDGFPALSPDGKSLLMDVDTGSEHERKDWDGPQPAVEKLDLGAEHAVRVTGKNDFIWEPFWLSDNEFLCLMQKENEKEPSIYRISIDGKNPKLIVKHARTPSASEP